GREKSLLACQFHCWFLVYAATPAQSLLCCIALTPQARPAALRFRHPPFSAAAQPFPSAATSPAGKGCCIPPRFPTAAQLARIFSGCHSERSPDHLCQDEAEESLFYSPAISRPTSR